MKVAIAGLRGHYSTLLDGLARMPDLELVAVCDSDETALAGVKDWKCATDRTRTYTSWEEMLEAEEIDILGEAGIDSDRHKVVLAALQRGIHCIAEKPMVNALPDLADVTRVWKASGAHLSMLLTMRFEPCYRMLRSVIESGELGEVCLATMQKSYRLGNRPDWQRNKATFSGIIPFIGIHALDLVRWCTGREFTEVYGACGNVGHPQIGDMEDQGQILCKLDNGGTASARLDYCRPAAAPTPRRRPAPHRREQGRGGVPALRGTGYADHRGSGPTGPGAPRAGRAAVRQLRAVHPGRVWFRRPCRRLPANDRGRAQGESIGPERNGESRLSSPSHNTTPKVVTVHDRLRTH